MSCSCLMESEGRGSTGGCRRIGMSDAIDVKRGMKALRRR